MKTKRMLTGCLAGTMLLGTMAMTAQAINVSQLKDVEPASWYYSHVKYVAEHNYMTGVTSDTFAPMREMTRAMFVTTLARLDGVKAATAKTEFEDVAADSWYASSVQWAVANGIITGVSATRFAPDSSITREQMCTMMARFIQYRAEKENKTFVGSVTETTFPDADKISSYAVEAVKQCQRWGLIYGDEDGYLNPQNNATRAQVAAVLQRLDTLLAAGQSNGGGAGGGGGDPVSSMYNVRVMLTTDANLPQNTFDMAKQYTVNANNDMTFSDIAKDLVNSDTQAISNTIGIALNKIKGKTVTLPVKEQQVTIKVEADGVISATVSMNVTDLVATTTRTATVTTDAMKDLLLRLQNSNGSFVVQEGDSETLEALIAKANELASANSEKELQKIQDKMDEFVQQNPEFEQALSGMTPEAVVKAAEEYKNQLDKVAEDIKDIPAGTTVEVPSVVMAVEMNLDDYFKRAVDSFNNEDNRDKAIARLKTELELGKFSPEQMAMATALYNQNNPKNYIINANESDGKLKLMDADTYTAAVQSYVTAICNFYDALDGNAAFYQRLLDRLEAKNPNEYGITYNFCDDFATLLADQDGILTDVNWDAATPVFTVAASVNDETYGKWLDLIGGRFGDYSSLLPDEIPDALSALVGNYTLTFTIDKQ